MDRRRLVLSLTDAGQNLLDGCRQAVVGLETKILGDLSAYQRAARGRRCCRAESLNRTPAD